MSGCASWNRSMRDCGPLSGGSPLHTWSVDGSVEAPPPPQPASAAAPAAAAAPPTKRRRLSDAEGGMLSGGTWSWGSIEDLPTEREVQHNGGAQRLRITSFARKG